MQWGTPVSHITCHARTFWWDWTYCQYHLLAWRSAEPVTLTLVLDWPSKLRFRMTQPVLSHRPIRFEVFEVDLQGGELRKARAKGTAAGTALPRARFYCWSLRVRCVRARN